MNYYQMNGTGRWRGLFLLFAVAALLMSVSFTGNVQADGTGGIPEPPSEGDSLGGDTTGQGNSYTEPIQYDNSDAQLWYTIVDILI